MPIQRIPNVSLILPLMVCEVLILGREIANMPSAGAKRTGFGAMNSRWGMEEFMRTKSFVASMSSHRAFAQH